MTMARNPACLKRPGHFLTQFLIALIGLLTIKTGLEYMFLNRCPWKYEDKGVNNFLKSVVNTIKAFIDTLLIFVQLMIVIGYSITRDFMSEVSYKVVIGATVTKFFLCEIDQAFMGTFLSVFLSIVDIVFESLTLIAVIHFVTINICKT